MAQAALKKEGMVGHQADQNEIQNDRLQAQAHEIRGQIGEIAELSFKEGVIKADAYGFYKQMAAGKDQLKIEPDKLPEKLGGMLKFAKEYGDRAIAIKKRLEKEVPKHDAEFLMEKLVVGNLNFMAQADAVDQWINQKIERIKNDFKEYQTLSKHPLAKSLAVMGKIKLSDEKTFTEAKVPERRKFLKETQELFWKKQVEEALEAKNAETLTEIYTSKLQKRLCDPKGKNGSIGQKTYDAFLEGFRKMAKERNFEGMAYWHKDFENQMQPRDAFSKKVRRTLRDDGLAEMENHVHDLGFTDMQTLYQAILRPDSKESKRLSEKYTSRLEAYRGKCASNHSIKAFQGWFDALPTDQKYLALDNLDSPEGMGQFVEQWKRIGRLNPKQQAFMKEKLNDKEANWGYTEFQKQLETFEAEGPVDENEEEAILENKLDDTERRKVIAIEEALKKKGDGAVEAFAQILRNITDGQSRSQLEAVDHQEEVKKAVTEREPLSAKKRPHLRLVEAEGGDVESNKDQSAQVDDHEVEDKLHKLDREDALNVIQVSSFKQVKNEDRRTVEVMANDQASLERLLAENRNKNYKSKAAGGNDTVTITTDTGSGKQKTEANTLIVMAEYLRAKRKKNNS